jgi:hypothetical protein
MRHDRKQSELSASGSTQNAVLNLHYEGHPLMNVRGPITGSAYTFSSVQPVQPVDQKDARYLLASPLFRLSI